MLTSGLFLFLLLILMRGGGGGPAPKSLDEAAALAHVAAEKKRREAEKSGDPQKHKEAAAAKRSADNISKAAKTAKSQPAPWPQAMPTGLPPFPGGWEFDEPPPQAVQARASQLLLPLWAKGAGTRKTEKTAGRWITYQAQKMGTKKGVVAYRVKAAFQQSA